MNKHLVEVIAEGCCAKWGAADLEKYARDEEAIVFRLMDQYELDPEYSRTIAKIICRIGLRRAKSKR